MKRYITESKLDKIIASVKAIDIDKIVEDAHERIGTPCRHFFISHMTYENECFFFTRCQEKIYSECFFEKCEIETRSFEPFFNCFFSDCKIKLMMPDDIIRVHNMLSNIMDSDSRIEIVTKSGGQAICNGG